MRKTTKKILGASTLAILLSTTAHAQIMDQIIVTAQKREENLQDVSGAVTAYQGDDLRARGISDIEALQFQAPNITIGDTFGFSNLFMRGLGLNTVFPNVDPSVTLYSDGAIISQPAAQLFSFFDLERLEVLRGPQGTLYGRNSTGGQINLITAKPTEELGGHANVSVGNYGAVKVDGAVSGPIIKDKLLGRFAIHSDTRNGFAKNELSGNDVNDRNRQALRAQLEYVAADNLDILLVGEYGRENDASNSLIPFGETFPFSAGGFPDLAAAGLPVPPGSPAAGALAPGVGGTLGMGNLNANDPAIIAAGGPTLNFFPTGNPRNVNVNTDPSNKRETISMSAIVDWAINDIVSVKNTFNYREFDADLIQDIDFSSNVTAGTQLFSFDSDHFSNELQFNVETNKIHGVGGFYYFNENVSNVNAIGVSPLGTDPLDNRPRIEALGLPTTGGQRVFLSGKSKIESWALYWNAVYDITPKLSIKAGGRYTSDTRSVFSENFVIPGGALGVSPSQSGIVLLFVGPPGPAQPPTVVTPGNNPAINPNFAFPFQKGSQTFTDYTNEFGLEWRPTDNILLYYTYAEGFKAGTAQIGVTNFITVPGLTPGFIRPEKITNHEGGLKADWFNGSLITNIAGFTYTVKGIQLDQTLPGGPLGFIPLFQNATSQDAWGLEFETYWQPVEQFRFNGSFAYLKTKFGSFVTTNPLVLIQTTDIGGNRARQSPQWSGAAHAEYDLPISLQSGDLVTAFVDIAYKGKQFFSEFNDPRLSADSYVVLDAALRYRFANDRFSITFWGKNLTDELIKSGGFVISTGLSIAGTYLPPRTYGTSIGFDF